jgi:hypothetical protein
VIWGDEAEIRSFEDRWQGGIQVYVNWMQERVVHSRNGHLIPAGHDVIAAPILGGLHYENTAWND